MRDREKAARRYWAWERAQILKRWGVTLDTWEGMGERCRQVQMFMVDVDLWLSSEERAATG